MCALSHGMHMFFQHGVARVFAFSCLACATCFDLVLNSTGGFGTHRRFSTVVESTWLFFVVGRSSLSSIACGKKCKYPSFSDVCCCELFCLFFVLSACCSYDRPIIISVYCSVVFLSP